MRRPPPPPRGVPEFPKPRVHRPTTFGARRHSRFLKSFEYSNCSKPKEMFLKFEGVA